ncbi:MAG: hypothetical protein HY051_05165 [Candidatus Aenigmarchaeota archaeon]|nr:hypothetical protein [Candidatus Aenigmarchaeota archaeon]
MAYQRSQLHKLYDPGIEQRPMRVADLMSGSGTNVVKTIEHQKGLAEERGKAPYEVVVICSKAVVKWAKKRLKK